MAKKNKASAVMELLKQGVSVREIRNRMSVSESYVYTIKKLMKTGVVSTPLELTKDMQPKPTDTSVDAVLDERGARYGNFKDHAQITQDLKGVAYHFADSKGKVFDVDQVEALDMIFHKIGRILNGDPNYADSWIDIAGYAKLVADRLEGRTR